MNRSLRTPWWWGIHLFTLLAVPFCLYMGSWQLDRFSARVESDRANRETRAAQTVEPLASMLPVSAETVGRRATATGSYDPRAQFLVPDRRVDGARGSYVLTMFRTEDGGALPVVRGWLPGSPAPRAVPPPPEGRITVTGALQAPENQRTKGTRAGGLPEGRLGIISSAALVNLLPYESHDAWITLPDPPAPLRAVPPVVPEGAGLDLKAFQNLGYTGEWFVFAGFVVFMWFRLRRRELDLSGPGLSVSASAASDTATSADATSADAISMAAGPATAASATALRAADARKDRQLKIVGTVLGTAFIGFVAWSGTVYITGQDYSGELVGFRVLSPTVVEARLTVRKDTDTVVVCTLRSLSEEGREVGRRDVRFPQWQDSVDRRVQVRTTGGATAVELVGCQDAAAG